VGKALCVRASMPLLLLRVVSRVFSSSLLFLRLRIDYRARQRISGRREGYISLFIVTFRKYILLFYLGRGDPQERY
jgi:hypothetical protein